MNIDTYKEPLFTYLIMILSSIYEFNIILQTPDCLNYRKTYNLFFITIIVVMWMQKTLFDYVDSTNNETCDEQNRLHKK